MLGLWRALSFMFFPWNILVSLLVDIFNLVAACFFAHVQNPPQVSNFFFFFGSKFGHFHQPYKHKNRKTETQPIILRKTSSFNLLTCKAFSCWRLFTHRQNRKGPSADQMFHEKKSKKTPAVVHLLCELFSSGPPSLCHYNDCFQHPAPFKICICLPHLGHNPANGVF